MKMNSEKIVFEKIKFNEPSFSESKFNLSEVIIPFSKNYSQDIYCGNEQIAFKNRHPIFRSLMRLEFEGAIRDFLSNI